MTRVTRRDSEMTLSKESESKRVGDHVGNRLSFSSKFLIRNLCSVRQFFLELEFQWICFIFQVFLMRFSTFFQNKIADLFSVPNFLNCALKLFL